MFIKWIANRIMFARAKRLCAWAGQHTARADRIYDFGSGTGHNAIALREQHNIEVRQFDVADMHWIGTTPEPINAFPKENDPKENYAGHTTTLLAHVLHYCDQPSQVLNNVSSSSDELLVLQSACSGPLSSLLLRTREFFYGRFPFYLARIARLIATPDCPLRPKHTFTRDSLSEQFAKAGLSVRSWEAKGWLGISDNLISLSRKPYEPRSAPQEVNASENDMVSVIIPARNEEKWIADTIKAALHACDQIATQGRAAACEVLVVDNGSIDRTGKIASKFSSMDARVKLVESKKRGAAHARNFGRTHASGNILVFVDADTRIPPDALHAISQHCSSRKLLAGITAIGSLESGLRAKVWWFFWNQVRRLPLPRAKAMPALMFCTAEAFDSFGPFDEEVAIGEEWPILADLYRFRREAVIYDRNLVARSSSRRMDQIRFGYSRTLLKYIWAILHRGGRIHYTDRIR